MGGNQRCGNRPRKAENFENCGPSMPTGRMTASALSAIKPGPLVDLHQGTGIGDPCFRKHRGFVPRPQHSDHRFNRHRVQWIKLVALGECKKGL